MLLSIAGLLFIGAAISAADTGQTTSKEYQIKIAYLYNFTKFVEWPTHSFPDASSPIVIGAYCSIPIGAELQRMVKDRKVKGRGIVVKTLQSVAEMHSTQLLFVCASQDTRLADIAQAVGNNPVLTVGESAAFRESGGMVVFVLEGDKIRFEIDAGSAERSGLKISSQLLQLAKVVRRPP